LLLLHSLDRALHRLSLDKVSLLLLQPVLLLLLFALGNLLPQEAPVLPSLVLQD